MGIRGGWAWGVVLGAWLCACGDDAPACRLDAAVGCDCDGGVSGTRTCGADGELGACRCEADAGPRIVPACRVDGDCSDGVHCNGSESCVAGRCFPGLPVRCDDGLACTVDLCSEQSAQCASSAPDLDGDGHTDATCADAAGNSLGDDCDDGDARRFPGNVELCDDEDVDEDCNPATYGAVDADGDGYDLATCCNGTTCGDDCDDLRPSVSPVAGELCDGFDNDCDGMVDESAQIDGFVDADRDGHGDPTMPLSGCSGAVGLAQVGDDCDDTDPARYPGLPEVCDTKDNDCDTIVDDNPVEAPWYLDADGDGFGDPNDAVISCAPPPGRVLNRFDCDDADAKRSPVAAEACDGKDNDCNGLADFAIGPNDFEDDDGDGVVDSSCGGDDCDDANPATGNAGVAEVCDGRDNDCDGTIDEDTNSQVWFLDADRDGYGTVAAGAVSGCSPVAGYSTRAGDCNDADPARNPGLKELCDGKDNDCNGVADEVPECACSCSLPNGIGVCAGNGCALLACLGGHGNCDGNPANGCETDLTTAENCGACGRDCDPRASCDASGATPSCVCNPGSNGNGLTCFRDDDAENCGGLDVVCGSGSCVGGACVRRVFQVAASSGGNLGGLSGADAICQTAANAASLGGTFKAWLSDSIDSPSTRFVHGTAPYVRTDGVLIANDWADLTDGSNAVHINTNAAGGSGALTGIWTGTNPNGTASGTHCSNWSATTGSGSNGQATASLVCWSGCSAIVCSNTGLGLYCFEQ